VINGCINVLFGLVFERLNYSVTGSCEVGDPKMAINWLFRRPNPICFTPKDVKVKVSNRIHDERELDSFNYAKIS
ncbi:MAG: hypothetical protein WA395_07280, partial [Nitrososphaeraceae archaeon]